MAAAVACEAYPAWVWAGAGSADRRLVPAEVDCSPALTSGS